MYATTATTTTSENSPARAQPAPSNQPPSCSSYPPPLPAGSPDSVLDALRRAGARIRALEARVLELEEKQAAVKDANEKEKVAALETKVKDLQALQCQQEAVTNKPLQNKIATIECELSNIKKLIRKPKESELSRKTCAICSKTFLKNAELEKHMSCEHNSPKDFDCTVCGKKFFLEWRLKKHARMHTVTPRICRYFSTKMACPFAEIGCKFSHTVIPEPAARHVARNERAEQTQFQYYHAGLQHGQAELPLHYYAALQPRNEEQPQPQHCHAAPQQGHGHAEQHQHHLAELQGHAEQSR